MINGERYYVSYEGLTNICSGCGIYGHMLDSCPSRVVSKPVDSAMTNQGMVAASQGDAEEGFIMARKPKPVVRTAGRPAASVTGNGREVPRRVLKKIPQQKDLGNISLSNAFDRLREDTEVIEFGKGNIINDGNKENSSKLSGAFKGKEIAKSIDGSFGGDPRDLNGGFRSGAGEKKWGLDMEMATSGKRSRVERDDLGRSENRFVRKNGDDAPVEMAGLAENISRNSSSFSLGMAAIPPSVDSVDAIPSAAGGMEVVRD
ncbi:unnamed protein product [Microthlaspi erraticum]|uniref:CCHC-type domain-containing protein n=1 Tax=Microthlaspi erraticum TaxID=1685480 RepID=A0A6D2K560_9BRAS|nr:unnamed protein product [Microthlaspi erraticum]